MLRFEPGDRLNYSHWVKAELNPILRIRGSPYPWRQRRMTKHQSSDLFFDDVGLHDQILTHHCEEGSYSLPRP